MSRIAAIFLALASCVTWIGILREMGRKTAYRFSAMEQVLLGLFAIFGTQEFCCTAHSGAWCFTHVAAFFFFREPVAVLRAPVGPEMEPAGRHALVPILRGQYPVLADAAGPVLHVFHLFMVYAFTAAVRAASRSS